MSRELSQEELRTRFESRVVPGYIESQRDGADEKLPGPPRFVSVGGQPGAGKGRVVDDVHDTLPGSVVVDADALRRFHPDYQRLMQDDPLRMPEATAAASGAWVGMTNEYLRSENVSAVVETTLRQSGMLRGEFEAFKAAGYETELRVVAVPLEVSRAATVSRYVEQVKEFGAGRWTAGASHDEAAANVRGTVRELVASGVVDRVVVQGRDGRVFHEADTSEGGAGAGEAAVGAVDRARDVRSLGPEQARMWIETTGDALRARNQLQQNDPDLVRVTTRLATQDADAVVPQAYPGDVAAQREALRTLEQAGNVPSPDDAQEPVETSREASFPPSSGDSTRAASEAGDDSRPSPSRSEHTTKIGTGVGAIAVD